MGSAPLDNDYYQASHHKAQRLRVVLRLFAQGCMLVVVLALGWWVMTTLGGYSLESQSDSPAVMAGPIYLAGCPVADTLDKSSTQADAGKVEGCSEEDVSHPISSRRAGGGLGERAHRAER